MLPNGLPDEGQAPEYNTVDAALSALRTAAPTTRTVAATASAFGVLPRQENELLGQSQGLPGPWCWWLVGGTFHMETRRVFRPRRRAAADLLGAAEQCAVLSASSLEAVPRSRGTVCLHPSRDAKWCPP